MKKIILPVLASIPFFAAAQAPFTIKGNTKSLKDGDKIYLVYTDGGARVTDSAMVANNTFEFKGNVKDSPMGNIFRNINPYVTKGVNSRTLDYTAFYIEPGNIVVNSTDSIKSAVASGTLSNDDNLKLKNALKPVSDRLKPINDEFAALTPEQQKDNAVVEEIRSRYFKIAAEQNPIYFSFVKANPNSPISLSTLRQLAYDDKLLAEVETAFAGLSAELRASKVGESIAKTIDAGKKTAIGVMAMDFTQNDVNDKPVKLSDFRGKYVLLDFWAAWCGPCRAENPNVVAAYNKYKDRGFTVLGVSLDQPGKKEDWLKAIKDDGLTWTQVSDLKYWQNEAAQLYGISSIPANFLLDPSGKIIAKGLREKALHDKLEELLGKKSK